MEKVTLTRDQHFKDATCGMLVAKGELFYTLERPWIDNLQNISCIPVGEYECEFKGLTPNVAGDWENVYMVKNVKDRDAIRIHSGNLASDTHGCILIGMGRNDNAVLPRISNSRMAKDRFNEIMKKEKFILSIVNLIKENVV